jgi:hypothetical protein
VWWMTFGCVRLQSSGRHDRRQAESRRQHDHGVRALAWRRRGGRKVIVAPPGCDDWAPPPKIDRALVKALARAHRWRRLLEEGRFGTLAELADAERISRSYVCRVLRLTLLAPDIVERILDGRPTAGLARLLEPFPVEWDRQRERFP